MKTTITIVLKNGQSVIWAKDEWDDYSYDSTAFIIKKNGDWIGFYNFSSIISVTLK